MHTLTMFDKIVVNISDEDWDYLCKNRIFSDTPSDEDIRTEFVIGTGITPNTPELWDKADEAFAKYIEDLREIQKLDLNKMCRDKLQADGSNI